MLDINKKKNKRKDNERHSRYGRTVRWLSLTLALVFSLTSLGAALPAGAESGASSVAESAASTAESSAESTATPTPIPEAKAYDSTVNVNTDKGKLTVHATADAGILPEDATLTVKPITKENKDTRAAYDQVEEKVQKNVADDDRKLTGFLAYDISFTQNDKEIEPTGKVNVTMNWENAATPDGSEQKDADVSVLHLAKNKDGSKEIKDTEVVNLTENKEKKDGDKNNQAEVKVNEESKAVEKAEMTVEGFSVFTITWTKNGTDATRIGNVNLHYVDVNGLEITRTTAITNADLSKYAGAPVKIDDWVKNDGTTRKVSGYVFQKATIESINGTVITGVKVAQDSENKNQYKLYYTTADDPDKATDSEWTQYTDSVSKDGANNADIYLVFKSTAQSVNVHYVDEDGTIIANPVYHYANETCEKYPNGFDIKLTDETQNPWVQSLENYTFTGRVHMGEVGWQGFAFSRVKAVKTGDNFHYQYSLSEEKPTGASDFDWTDLTATDVYLIYKKTMPTTLPSTAIKICFVDSDGKAMEDEAGNPLDRVVDATTWTKNQWQNLQAYSESVNGYDINDMAIIQTNNGDTDFLKQPGSTSNSGLEDDKRISKVSIEKGRAFRYLRYTGSVFQAGNGYQIDDPNGGGGGTIDKHNKTVPDSKINRYWNISGTFTIYLVYKPAEGGKTYSYTIHYVDEDGNDIPGANDDTHSFTDDKYIKGDKFTVKLSGTNEGSERASNPSSTDTPIAFSSNIAKAITGYTAKEYGFLGRATSASGGLVFKSITYEKTGDNQWSYQITDNNGTTGEKKKLNLTNLNFYVVYEKASRPTDNAHVTFHYVDMQGKQIAQPWEDTNITLKSSSYSNWDGFTLSTPRLPSRSNYIPTGYTYQKYAYIGVFGKEDNKITSDSTDNNALLYRYDSSNKQWHTGRGKTSSATLKQEVYLEGTTSAYITDVYFVYARNSNVKVHYVYVAGKVSDDNDALKLSKISNNDGGADRTLATPLPTSADTAIFLDRENKDKAKTNYAPSSRGNNKYIYAGTRIGPAWSESLTYSDLGTNVRSVYNDKGQLMYYGETTTSLSYLRRDTWYHAENNGRRFELTRSGTDEKYNYTLSDSRHGSLNLNQSDENTYVATYHGEAQTTEYKVTYNSSTSIYNLTVSDWTPNNQTDVYEIYVDSSKYSLWIEDDQMYSGYLIANKISSIPSNGTYAWYKTVTNSAGETTTSTVLRKQTGIHYNVEYDPKARTWLDVEADEGGLNSTTQTAVSYYVTYTYTDSSGEHTIQSQPLSIPYYSELKNGGFETPKYTKPINQVKNAEYRNSDYKLDGVWQSTGTGTEGKPGDKDYVENVNIEIVNTVADDGSFKGSYRWNGDAPYAKEGNQFAELNCSAAGALYQDVVTHPNEQLHYWFSHRARGEHQNSTPEYDTMYLVIMPTKLAMTSGSDGGELKTQSDLIDFISAHGGFDYNLATSVSQEITHAEDDDGILILKVSSNDQFWHTVRSLNGYIAKAGLTRFFFTAGPTSWNGENGSRSGVEKATHGNFLDDVGFSQDPPSTDGFNLSVTKTFTGLNDDQLKGLAEQITANDGNVTSNPNPFKITISDQFVSDKGGLTDANSLVALNGAKLGFNVSGSEGNYTFTPVAVSKEDEHILSGTVTKNQDGSITMHWDFLDQSMVDKEGNTATGDTNRFYYTVKEENNGVKGMYLTSTETHNNTDKDGHKTSGSGGSQYIRQGDSAAFTFSNTYKNSSASEQPQMIVTKTFSGMTPQAVDALLPNYTLKLQQGTSTDSVNTVTLVADTANPVKSEEGVKDAFTEGRITDVTVTQTKNDDSSTTLRWLIKGWGANSNYTITEEGYDTPAYPIASAKVTYAGTTTDLDSSDSTKTKSSVSVGTASKIKVDSAKTKRQGSSEETITTVQDTNRPTADTNLIAAQYTSKENGQDKKHYFVWTPTTLGANTSQAICDQINEQFKITTDDDKAKINNTDFRSSANPGTVSVGTGGAGTISYDSETQTLSFTGSGTLTWNQFFSTRYWVGSADSQDTGKYTDTDIAVANSYDPAVRIMKESSGDNPVPLSGAEFKLYTYNTVSEANTKQYLIMNDSKLGWGEADKAIIFKTGSDGIAVSTETGHTSMEIINGLKNGTYYLEETKAPAGYNMPAKNVVALKVDERGIVSQITKEADVSRLPEEERSKVNVNVSEKEAVTIDWNSPYYTITVKNSAGSALPSTGGTGTWPFIFTGLLLMLTAGGWLGLRAGKKAKSVAT